MNLSVCIATYNGGNYILQQVQSILNELGPRDEIILVDDCSSDGTVIIVKGLNDVRIKIYINNQNRGINYSFERAICLANNDIIFLSDQDDVWLKGRISLMVNKLLETGALLLSSNSEFINKEGKIILYSKDELKEEDSFKYCKNILKIFLGTTPYYGCAMAFQKKLKDIILPMPSFIESHDLWIAMAGNIIRSSIHLDQKTLLRRIHDKNASVIKRRLFPKIWSRFIFAISFANLFSRNKFFWKNNLSSNK